MLKSTTTKLNSLWFHQVFFFCIPKFCYQVFVVQSHFGIQLLQPREVQSIRLLCPWDFPGKNTAVGCHFLLQGIFHTQGLKPLLPPMQISCIAGRFFMAESSRKISIIKYLRIQGCFVVLMNWLLSSRLINTISILLYLKQYSLFEY